MPSLGKWYNVTSSQNSRLLRRFIGLAALFTLLFGIANARDARGQVCPANRTIGNVETLNAALRCAAPGSTLKLAPVSFGSIEIHNPIASGLTITSVDPLHPARFSALAIHGATGFTLRNLKIGGPPPSGWRYAMLIFRSSGFSANNIELIGGGDAATAALDSAIMVRNVDGAQLSQLRIAHHRNGISLLDVRNVDVFENSITNMQVDGIRGGGINDARIARNVIGTFHPISGDHPDGIQLWSRNQKGPAENILIEGNLILRGNGAPIQGIFVTDRIKLPFRKLVIRNNLCVGTMYNGITVIGGESANISGNSVIPLVPQISWIRVENSRNVEVTGNYAGRFLMTDSITTPSHNRTGPVQHEASNAIREWRKQLNLPQAKFPI